MRKIMCIAIALLSLVAPLQAQENRDDLPILTVLDFTVQGVSQVEMKTIISILSSSLFQMERFTVIDVSQRENILSEIEFSSSGCTDESCMLEIGKLLAAEMIVVGSLSKIGSRYVLSSKLLETQTGKTLGTADGIYADLDAMLDDLGTFSAQLVKQVVRTSEPTVVEEEPKTEEEPSVAPEPAEEPEVEVAEEPEAEEPPPAPEPKAEKPPREPLVINWKKTGGIGLTATGVAALGVGGYFSVNALVNVRNAWLAYDEATDVTEIESLYNAYLATYDDQQPWFMNGLYIAGAGVLAGGLGALLLLLPDKDAPVEISAAVLPLPRALGMRVSVRY